MPYSHKANLNELSTNVGITDGYDYTDNDPYGVIESYFQFCQTNLSEECGKYHIQPARIYIRRMMTVNGRAGKAGKYYIIAINLGTIIELFRLFTDNWNIFEEESLAEFRPLSEKIDSNLDYLLFQLCMQFTFYHESAHLIQKSPIQQNWMQEKYMEQISEGDGYLPNQHIYEFDADIHGSAKAALHIIEYWERQEKDLQTAETLELLIALGAAAVFSYFIYLMRNYSNLYYRAESHPHPLVRISYMVDNFIKVSEAKLYNQIKVDPSKVLRLALTISEELFRHVGRDDVQDFAKVFLQESEEIAKFINGTLIPQSLTKPELVMNRDFNAETGQ
jgi:hypothetical protein